MNLGPFFIGQSHFLPYSQYVHKWSLYGNDLMKIVVEIFSAKNQNFKKLAL